MTKRPLGVTLLAGFFAAGATICVLSIITLVSPGGWLEWMWRADPHKREAFAALGIWGILILLATGTGCALSAIGLWRTTRWGRWLAIGMLAANALGDLVTGIVADPHALVGVPIAAALVVYLLRRR